MQARKVTEKMVERRYAKQSTPTKKVQVEDRLNDCKRICT